MTSFCLAHKYFFDIVYEDESYAKIIGVSTKRFAIMETYFLKLIDYELFVQEEDFQSYKDFILDNKEEAICAKNHEN